MITMITGSKWGDEGKGRWTDHFTYTTNAGLNVRFNGGGQGGGSVYFGRLYHKFSLLGAGTFEGARTHISKYVRFNPYGLMDELERLANTRIKTVAQLKQLITLDERCLITTPFHEEQSKMMASRHNRGTVGVGAGETWRHAQAKPDHALYARDLRDPVIIREKLALQAEDYAEAAAQSWLAEFGGLSTTDKSILDNVADYIHWACSDIQITNEQDWQDMLVKYPNIVMEGTQGVLLDQDRGDRPYVTQSNTTFDQALELLEGYTGEKQRVGCMRILDTRHGPGPFPTEQKLLSTLLPDKDNATGKYNGAVRVGWFDAAAARRSFEITNGVDILAVSHWDLWSKMTTWKIGDYQPGEKPTYTRFTKIGKYREHMETAIGKSIDLMAFGPYRIDVKYS